jgi:hypothetical protein
MKELNRIVRVKTSNEAGAVVTALYKTGNLCLDGVQLALATKPSREICHARERHS